MPITAVGSGMCHRVNDARGKRRLRGDLVDGGLLNTRSESPVA